MPPVRGNLGGWELHVHRDLAERLWDIAGSPKAVIPLYAVVVVVVRDHRGYRG